jgi:hypothetical protein
VNRQQAPHGGTATPDLFSQQAISDQVQASATLFLRDECAQITFLGQLPNKFGWDLLFAIVAIRVRDNLLGYESPESSLIVYLLWG